MRLVLIGPPGSGKGTQAKLLSEKFSLSHISTGNILREAVRNDTQAGRQAHPYFSKGNLVPDELVNRVVRHHFEVVDGLEDFVMDGYPRTVGQAAEFDRILGEHGFELDVAVAIVVDDEEVVQRISGRRVCATCGATFHLLYRPPRVGGVCDICASKLEQREDDREETVRTRLRVYHQTNERLLEYYRRQQKLSEVSGEAEPEAVFARIAAIVYDKAEREAASDRSN